MPVDEGGSEVGTSLTWAEESQLGLPDRLPTSAYAAALCGSGDAMADGGSCEWPAMREWVGIFEIGAGASAGTQTGRCGGTGECCAA